MSKKRMSNNKKLTFILFIAIAIGALMYCVFTLLGADEKSRLALVIGIGIAGLYYLIRGIIKIKKDGVLFDERDIHIEDKSNAISYNIFQILMLIIAIITYASGNIKVNVSGLMFLLFTLMMIIDTAVKFTVKRKN